MAGIEPASSAWKAEVLPLHNARVRTWWVWHCGFDVKMPHARASTKAMLHEMEEKFPKLFVSLNAAFGHISDDAFFDPKRWDV